MFQYYQLVINALLSPQVLLFTFVLLALKNKNIIQNIKSITISAGKLELAMQDIHVLKEKLDTYHKDYIRLYEVESDLITKKTTDELDKLGAKLTKLAPALDDIDFTEKYLSLKAKPNEVYAASCAIKARPQPKFLNPVVNFISEITATPSLNGIRKRILFTLVQCIEKIIIIDGLREPKVVMSGDIKKAIEVLEEFACHKECKNDHPTNETDGIPSLVEKIVNKISSRNE